MPKICAFCSFLYQFIRITVMVAINYQVIHKICGRYFSTMVYLLPNTKIGHFLMCPIASGHHIVSLLTHPK